ncbi:MAG TPA: class I SAM-dependent methyltransferase [Usitatibacter sp.]|nr:class I SAM-dependent methyltransferase [Usitatibacter sp.]
MSRGDNESEAFLRKFHARHAGATARAFRTARDGPSTYERLAELVPHTVRSITVLDLGCGDGPLLSLLRDRGQPNLSLVGVDMSADELRLAQRRLGPGVQLWLQRAQDLSMTAASVDYVLSHLAMMLMDPLEDVIQQVRRVLKPGGVLAAVVNGEMVRGDAWEAFAKLARSLVEREGKVPAIGDRRMYSVDGLRGLFNAGTGFEEPIAIEELVVDMGGRIEEVRERLMLTYFPGLLSEEGVKTLLAETTEMLRSFERPDATIPCSLGLRLVRCTRRLA